MTNSKEKINVLDKSIYVDYKRRYDKPKPKFQSVPLDEFPPKWYEYFYYFFLVILLNCFTFGFLCLMLYLRYILTTEIFVQITCQVSFAVLGVCVIGTYVLGQKRKTEEREMFDPSLRWQPKNQQGTDDQNVSQMHIYEEQHQQK